MPIKVGLVTTFSYNEFQPQEEIHCYGNAVITAVDRSGLQGCNLSHVLIRAIFNGLSYSPYHCCTIVRMIA